MLTKNARRSWFERHVPARMLLVLFIFCSIGIASSHAALAQDSMPGVYGLKVYAVNSALYPFVQAYFRTFDRNMMPLVNLNELNVGLMVKGQAYDVAKKQYFVQSIRQRQEATRTVIVLDASKSMAGRPFDSATRACARYIDSKRPQDEMAILAIRDTKDGYDIVSEFERDGGALGRRLADIKPDGNKTRLYDAIGAGLQACGTASQGSVLPSNINYITSCSVLVISDGQDDGSAISREELNARITGLRIPVPIYSLAYSKINPKHFKNLEALSKNSFGKYYLIAEAYETMQRVLEEIQNIMLSDYVVTFRAYQDIDGEEHSFKVGIEYPSGSGKYTYENAKYEAIQAPSLDLVLQKWDALKLVLDERQDRDPYYHPYK